MTRRLGFGLAALSFAWSPAALGDEAPVNVPVNAPVDAPADARAETAPVAEPAPVASTSPPVGPPVGPAPADAPDTKSSDALVDPTMRRSWWEGKDRFFFATTVDGGYLYVRPRASFGYGLPFTRWFGVDVNPVATGAGLAAYGGLRLSLPHFDVRVGSRYFSAFQHSYLPVKDNYGRLDLENAALDRARIVTHEVELDGTVPVGPGEVLALASGSYVANVPNGAYVFEETLKVVVNPPLVWRLRGGYLFRLGAYNQHSVGFVADVLNVPRRESDTTVRAGPVFRVVLSRHFEVRGSFVLTVWSPDRLGLSGGDFTELGVRYRWATE